MTTTNVRQLLRRACRDAGGQAAWARRYRVSSPYITDILYGRRSPGPKVLRALGLRAVITYAPCRRVNGVRRSG